MKSARPFLSAAIILVGVPCTVSAQRPDEDRPRWRAADHALQYSRQEIPEMIEILDSLRSEVEPDGDDDFVLQNLAGSLRMGLVVLDTVEARLPEHRQIGLFRVDTLYAIVASGHTQMARVAAVIEDLETYAEQEGITVTPAMLTRRDEVWDRLQRLLTALESVMSAMLRLSGDPVSAPPGPVSG